jgi:O-antigen ligase
MVKKKRNSSAKPSAEVNFSAKEVTDYTNEAATGNAFKTQAAVKKSVLSLPLEFGKGDWTAIILSLMLFFTPALGVPSEEMLQDTLKSIIVSFMTLGAVLILFLRHHNFRNAFRWHALMWLPLMLMAYALGSMVWSHTYLGGVEAIRWFIFSLILWLTMNAISRERVDMLVWGIHLGAFAVALLGAAQFWFNATYIPQGPPPAASFVNRNFAAEFLACTVIFSGYLLLNTRGRITAIFMAFSFAFNIVFLMMCGTRSAMVGSAASLVVMLIIALIYKDRFAFKTWDTAQRIVVPIVFILTLVSLSSIPSGNPNIEAAMKETGRSATPYARAFERAKQISINDGSFGVRLVMWKATERMIKARPLSGVGAGAWEVDAPLYQAEGSQLETDYYVHNEILQLLGEYGLVGWIFLALLLSYLLLAAYKTLRLKGEAELSEGPMRAVALTSLLTLLIVSNIGFPWRLAATGALFAVCLGLLAASDARLGYGGWWATTRLNWNPTFSQVGALLTVLCIALAAYITQKSVECESKIVRAVKIALTVSQSGDPGNPKFDKTKREMLKLIKEGTDINPHYRKITPMVADELAKWGDWPNATWIWESVISSRPYVAALMTNTARGFAQQGNFGKANEYMVRAKKVQPKAVAVRSLEVILLSRGGKEKEALQFARQYMDEKTVDVDLLNAAYVLGIRASDFALAIRAMQMRNEAIPSQKTDGLMKMGSIYAGYLRDETNALESFRAAVKESGNNPSVRAQIPQPYQAKL